MLSVQRKVIVYSHLFPFPPRHGAHQRMRQLIKYFLGRGFSVHLVAGSAGWDNKFDSQAVDLPIAVHELNLARRGAIRVDALWRRIRKSSDRQFSISAQLAFSRILRKIGPDLIVINYCTGMRVISNSVSIPTIVDAHDFLSMSNFLANRARALIDEGAPTFEPLTEISKTFVWGEQCRNEADLISRADLVLGISKAESTIFAELTKASVLTFNYHEDDVSNPSTNTASPRAMGLMPIGTGDNPHNRLGAILLDKAFQQAGDVPAGALVAGTGRASNQLHLGPWFEAVGEIDDYQQFAGQFAYGICPAFWGTGAQIKQYEFAARGMPVVGYRDTLDLEAWVHDYNAILVSTPEELRSAIVDLSNNRERLTKLRRGAARLQRTLAERRTLQERELDARVDMLIGASA